MLRAVELLANLGAMQWTACRIRLSTSSTNTFRLTCAVTLMAILKDPIATSKEVSWRRVPFQDAVCINT